MKIVLTAKWKSKHAQSVWPPDETKIHLFEVSVSLNERCVQTVKLVLFGTFGFKLHMYNSQYWKSSSSNVLPHFIVIVSLAFHYFWVDKPLNFSLSLGDKNGKKKCFDGNKATEMEQFITAALLLSELKLWFLRSLLNGPIDYTMQSAVDLLASRLLRWGHLNVGGLETVDIWFTLVQEVNRNPSWTFFFCMSCCDLYLARETDRKIKRQEPDWSLTGLAGLDKFRVCDRERDSQGHEMHW